MSTRVNFFGVSGWKQFLKIRSNALNFIDQACVVQLTITHLVLVGL